MMWLFETFEENASKETSSPILERPASALERGRRELDGTVASNKAIEAVTILHKVGRRQ